LAGNGVAVGETGADVVCEIGVDGWEDGDRGWEAADTAEEID